MTISEQAPHFSMLSGLSQETSSEGRRELLRKVTEALDLKVGGTTDGLADLDHLLAAAASEYSKQIRLEIAQLIATGPAQFGRTTEKLAFDDIDVARPILKHSSAISEATLLKIIEQKSQSHLMAITERRELNETLSHALVERGDDHVVSSLLKNETAAIADHTYENVAARAIDSVVLQGPLVRRSGVPLDLLNELYMNVEAGLRREILDKMESVPGDELEKAFKRSRNSVSTVYREVPDDFPTAKRRIDSAQRAGKLAPANLIALLREGPASRTAFKVAFARLSDVEFDLIERTVEGHDLDTLALLCRGSGFERALFVALAISLVGSNDGMARAEEFGALYESVPVQAAQRALRFWKVRAAA